MGGSDRSAAPFGIRCLGGPKAGVTHLSSSQRRCFWTLNRWHFWVASMVMWYGHAPRSVHTAWGTLAPAQGSHPRQGEGCEIQLRPHVGGHRSFWKEEIAPLFLEALRRNIEFSCARRSLLFSRGPGSIPRSWDPGMQSWAWAS